MTTCERCGKRHRNMGTEAECFVDSTKHCNHCRIDERQRILSIIEDFDWRSWNNLTCETLIVKEDLIKKIKEESK